VRIKNKKLKKGIANKEMTIQDHQVIETNIAQDKPILGVLQAKVCLKRDNGRQ
jgi:hypothetical protein